MVNQVILVGKVTKVSAETLGSIGDVVWVYVETENLNATPILLQGGLAKSSSQINVGMTIGIKARLAYIFDAANEELIIQAEKMTFISNKGYE